MLLRNVVVLGLSRATVRAAYQELEAMGYLRTVPGSGTFVCARSHSPGTAGALEPLLARRTHLISDSFLRELMAQAIQPIEYPFEVGMPDSRLLPLSEFQAVIHDIFARRSETVLGYSPTEGLRSLRGSLARTLLPMRGLVDVAPDEILIVTGSMQGLDLVGRLLVEPGDSVIVEDPTFPGAIQVFRSLGAKLVAVPTDRQGLVADGLEPLIVRTRPKLIYVQPTLQNPTGATLALRRRHRLLELAARHGVPILEDDAYGLLAPETPDGRAVLPLKAEDEHGVVIYLSTLSKVISPGLRVGYLVAEQGLVRELARIKQITDLHTSTVSQTLVESWLSSGRVREHVRSCRAVYAQRLRAALEELDESPWLVPTVRPAGGFYLFCRLPDGLTAAAVRLRSVELGVAFACGDGFSPNRSFCDHIRLCVSRSELPTIRVGIRRLLRLLEEMSGAMAMSPAPQG